MQAARSPECNVQFLAVGDSGNRECSPLQRPVISTCNQTGLWSCYHQHVDYACANFTSVVFGKYKNVFCALCNGRYDYQRVKYDLLRWGGDQSNMARVSFFALLQLDDDDPDTVTSSSARASEYSNTTRPDCQQGHVLHPFTCKCRPLSCWPGMQLKGDNCTDVFSRSNHFGVHVCARFTISSNDVINMETYKRFAFSVVFGCFSSCILSEPHSVIRFSVHV
ncbi:hypothetical protein BaRGS_00037445 [Batillaria attramentaria]|uniref:Uncharacterized protein n=1 Tax=Batillaria attramentaria TaxID=370345 RepID=A0ABD0J8W2_9CAEN